MILAPVARSRCKLTGAVALACVPALSGAPAAARPAVVGAKVVRYVGRLPGGSIRLRVRARRVTITFQASAGCGELPSGTFPATVTRLRGGRFSAHRVASVSGATDESQATPTGTLTVSGRRRGGRVTGQLRYDESSSSLFVGTSGHACSISSSYSARRR